MEATSDSALLDRRESSSLFLFKREGEPDETATDRDVWEAERRANQKIADELADEEQRRRIEEEKDREDELAIVRQINIEYSIAAEEEEQQRRVCEYEITKVQEQLLRERSKSEAVAAIECERARRLSELQSEDQEVENQRLEQQDAVARAVETERVRRLSLPEHLERVPSAARSSFVAVKGEEEDESEAAGAATHQGMSEIPVAAASKLVVDEHSEWRGSIASDNPDVERDCLLALRTSLDAELRDEKRAKYRELVGDVRLLRFLRGHKMDVALAATKYREMLALRDKLGLDAVRDSITDKNMTFDSIPGFDKIVTHLPFYSGYDLSDVSGANVFYLELTGFADLRGLLKDVSEDEWLTFVLYSLEHRAMVLDDLSRQREQLVRTVLVRDLSSFSIARFNPKLLARLRPLASIATTGYPETVSQVLILNAPWAFQKVWRAVRALLQETQLPKIHMDGAKSTEKLLELVGGRDKLPRLLGGKSTEPPIPQTGYLGRDSYVLMCEGGATQAEIRAGDNMQLPFRMAVNDTICWEFALQALDVEFCVKYRTQGVGGAQEADKVAPTRTTAGSIVAGSFTATEDGTVVLAWDNTYSWTRGKRVAYKAKVVKSTHDFSSLDISGNDCV